MDGRKMDGTHENTRNGERKWYDQERGHKSKIALAPGWLRLPGVRLYLDDG